MNIKKIGITSTLLVIILFLVYLNIGLHISGPSRLEEVKDKLVLDNVKSRFPLIHSLYQHNFKYVTYSSISAGYAYVFDYEGYLVMKKEFNESMFDEIKEIVKRDYGLEDVEVNIGFGYDNMVFVVEEENIMIYFDYDTKEVVYYLKGNLV